MSNPLDWYERGREVLRSWAATSATATEAARMAPLGRALDCVDAADVLVVALEKFDATDPSGALDHGTDAALDAYRKARSTR